MKLFPYLAMCLLLSSSLGASEIAPKIKDPDSGDDALPRSARSPLIVGSGTTAVRKWKLADTERLTEIQAYKPGLLYITGGDSTEGSIHADDNTMKYLSIRLIGERLVMRKKKRANLNPTTPIIYTVQLSPLTCKTLCSITTGLTTHIKTPIITESLWLQTIGDCSFFAEKALRIEKTLSVTNRSGAIKLEAIAAQDLYITNSGTSSLSIGAGKSNNGRFLIAGSSQVKADKLLVDNLHLSLSDTGSLACSVQEEVAGFMQEGTSFIDYGNGCSATHFKVARSACYQKGKLPVEELEESKQHKKHGRKKGLTIVIETEQYNPIEVISEDGPTRRYKKGDITATSIKPRLKLSENRQG